MSRVQCLECGMAVVVDPTGICPEGHLVGRAGVRVAGAMGSAVPHPDEPEPWVATVVLDEADVSPAAHERTIRPLQIACADATEAAHGEATDHESMLRELHALGDVREATPPSAVPQTETTPVTEAPPVAQAPPPPQDQVVEGFAELSALEAAFHALGYDEDGTLGGDRSDAPAGDAPAGTGPDDDLADLEGLFAPPTPSSSAPAADGDQVADLATSAPSAPAEPSETDVDEAPRAKDAGLDITNFTARGGKVGSGRGGLRKRFGR